MNITKQILGVDIGGVIIDRVNDRTDTSFMGENYLRTTSVPYAFAAIRRLADERFGARNIFLISKCGENVERKTLKWLHHQCFWEMTKVKPEHIRFCRERHEKAAICAELGITHFVDDRLEVLSHLETVPTRYLFKPRPAEVVQFKRFLPSVRLVESWEEIIAQELRIGA